ncbi:hypothetical protein GOODEAATRI_018287 [Goodea atripinnis]|uniref:MHC class I antigen n=1 Tax=Goodea atripinnis TaxID=208336 RepID=A0ABV0NBP6_9TELE
MYTAYLRGTEGLLVNLEHQETVGLDLQGSRDYQVKEVSVGKENRECLGHQDQLDQKETLDPEEKGFQDQKGIRGFQVSLGPKVREVWEHQDQRVTRELRVYQDFLVYQERTEAQDKRVHGVRLETWENLGLVFLDPRVRQVQLDLLALQGYPEEVYQDKRYQSHL